MFDPPDGARPAVSLVGRCGWNVKQSKEWIKESAAMALDALRHIGEFALHLLDPETRKGVLEGLSQGHTPPDVISDLLLEICAALMQQPATSGSEAPMAGATQRAFGWKHGVAWWSMVDGATLLDVFGEFAENIEKRAAPFNAANHGGVVSLDALSCGKSHFHAIGVILRRIVDLADRGEHRDLGIFVARLPFVRLYAGVELEETQLLAQCSPEPEPAAGIVECTGPGPSGQRAPTQALSKLARALAMLGQEPALADLADGELAKKLGISRQTLFKQTWAVFRERREGLRRRGAGPKEVDRVEPWEVTEDEL